MCGIAGIAQGLPNADAAREVLARMGRCLRHRGPDGEGVLWHERDRVGFAHRRLAVMDPSPAGAQPMESASGRHAIVFNGEVCNAAALAAELTGHGWRPRGRSDTEVMLAAFDAWGVVDSITRFAGMFAFAVHDRERRTLHLVRDRLGIKPLHWGWCVGAAGRTLAFASELRALLEVPGFDRSPDHEAIASMLSHGCVTGKACVWRGARKLAPGHRLELDLASGEVKESCWWDATSVATAAIATPFVGSDSEAIEHAGELLDRVVREHLVSDVPIGCLLSGGIDSAAVAAAVRGGAHDAHITAFTAAPANPDFDESANALRTARALEMPLHRLSLNADAMVEAARHMSQVHDEPFADSSQLPTWLLCAETRRHVAVVLSGDGGDEVFGGYRRHVHAASAWRRSRAMPTTARGALAGAMTLLSPDAWTTLLRPVSPMLPRRMRSRAPGASIHKWARSFGARSEAAAYDALTEVCGLGGGDGWWREADAARLPDFLRRMQLMDQTGYLVDDVLVKVDRASMAHGLEVRVPLLDHRVVEFAWRLPARMKVRDGRGKWLLRSLLARRVPTEVLDAPKTGFAVPIGELLRGPLHAWASDLLRCDRLRAHAMLDAARVERAWRATCAGRDAAQHEIWCVLMYLAWAERWGVTP